MATQSELIEIILFGSPAEQKIATEQLEEMLRATLPPATPEVKGDLIETYTAGDYTVKLYSHHGRFNTQKAVNPSAALMRDRGSGLITQPDFASRIGTVAKRQVVKESRVYINSATILIEHKSGSATTRRVSYTHRRGHTYKDCRNDKSLDREQFIATFPKPLQPLAAEIVFHLEVEALPEYQR